MAKAQWVPEEGIFDGPIDDIQILGDKLFLISNQNLYEADTINFKWEFLEECDGYAWGLSTEYKNDNGKVAANCYSLNLSTIYSEDGGQNWQNIISPGGAPFIAGDNIYYAVESSDLHKSEDSGQTSRILYQIPENVPFLIQKFTAIGSDTLLFGTDGLGLQYSSNGGESFEKVEVDGLDDIVIELYSFDSIVYVSGYEDGQLSHYKSVNYGINFEQIDLIVEGYDNKGQNYHMYYDGESLLYLGQDTIAVSNNLGQEWSVVKLPLAFTPEEKFTSGIISGNLIIAGSTRSVYVTRDNGLNWKEINSGLVPTNSVLGGIDFSFYASTNHLYLKESNKLYRKNLNNYSKLTVPQPYGDFSLGTVDSILWISTRYSEANKFRHHVSFDSGDSFQQIDLPDNTPISDIEVVNNTLLLTVGNHIYQSLQGLSWELVKTFANTNTTISNITDSNLGMFAIMIADTDDNIRGPKLVKSFDSGITWEEVINAPTDTLNLAALRSDSDYLYVHWYNGAYYGEGNSGFYRFDGSEWILLNQDNSSMTDKEHIFVTENILGYTIDSRIFLSDDKGESFKVFINGIITSQPVITSMVSFEDTVYVSLGRKGLWKSAISDFNFSDLPRPNIINGSYQDGQILLEWESEQLSQLGYVIEIRRGSTLNPFISIIKSENLGRSIEIPLEKMPFENAIYANVYSFDNYGWSMPSDRVEISVILSDNLSEDLSLTLYPNPITNYLYISGDINVISSINIYGSTGMQIVKEFTRSGDYLYSDMSDIPEQMIFVVINYQNGKSVSRRLILL